MTSTFSLLHLRKTNPELFQYFAWSEDDWPGVTHENAYIHMGCESHVLPGFVNLDFISAHEGILEWEALNLWPDRLNGRVKVFYSEDFIEHFFLNEQLYLYCSMNCLLQEKGLVRTLTPNMDSLWRYGQQFDLEDCLQRGDDYYVSIMRCRSGMDAVNMGMRMGGHRWLHTPDSLSRVARMCGFAPHSTTCANSSDPKLCGINLRMEYGNGISFALEMVKTRCLRRLCIPPAQVQNADHIETLSERQRLYRSTNNDPAVQYDFSPIEASRIALINIRGANVSQHREHNFAKCYFRLNEAGGIYADRTLQSVPYMNIFNSIDIQTAMADQTTLASIRFDPGEREGEYFTTGPLEIFYYDDVSNREISQIEIKKDNELSNSQIVTGTETYAEAKSFRCRQGNVLCFPFDQPIARSLELYGEWAQRETDAMLPFISEGATVIDVGAHVGLHTLTFAKHVGPKGRVLAIEPRSDLFALLTKNIHINGFDDVAIPKHTALSDSSGKLYVPFSKGSFPQNLAATNLRQKGPGESVSCSTLDDIQLDRLDFLKIDAEGHSAAVVRGAQESIKRFRPVIAQECSDYVMAHSSFNLLKSWNYCCFHRSFFAYNQDNMHAQSWNIFGMAEEGMLFAVPRERLSQYASLLHATRPVFTDADVIRAITCNLSYGGVPLKGNEPWYLVCAWAEERRQRQEGQLNELLAGLRAQIHAERAQQGIDVQMQYKGFLNSLERHFNDFEKGSAKDKKGDLVLDQKFTQRLKELLAGPVQSGVIDGKRPFQFPFPPNPKEWVELSGHYNSEETPLIDVVVPVYNAAKHTEACLYSILSASSKTPFRLIVIDDASTDKTLITLLDKLANLGLIDLVRHTKNRGFVRSANDGMSVHNERDIVLLNSDTLVFDHWLDKLRHHAISNDRTGTVTSLSNNATIYSYPAVPLNNSHALYADPAEIDRLTTRIHAGQSIDIPTAVGFCMYVRHKCLAEVGLFNERLFGKGYGEENDFCLRATAKGWSHKLAIDTYVWHDGEMSFSGRATHYKDQAYKVICGKYPYYKQTVHAFLRNNPLLYYFNCLSSVRLEGKSYRNDRKTLLFVAHNWGGGTERELQAMAEVLQQEGVPVLIMRPTGDTSQCRISLNSPDRDLGPEELSFTLPDNIGALISTLDFFKVAHVHVHCMAGYHAAMPDVIRLLCRLLNIDYDFLASDFLCVCPRAHAVQPDGQYCGVPEAWECNQCLQDSPPWCGHVEISRWRDRYAAFVREARRLFVPSQYMAQQMGKWFPLSRPAVRPYPELILPDTQQAARYRGADEDLHVIIIGAIGEHKGMNNLLACAHDATTRRLPIRFTVLGYTCDDTAAKALGIEISGRYKDEDALHRLGALEGHIAFLPSIWPETYCYTLSVAVLAGLFPVVFDLGAQAERIKTWDWGLCLSTDLNGDGTALNNALLECSIPPPPEEMIARITAPGRFDPDYFTGYYDLPLSMLEM